MLPTFDWWWNVFHINLLSPDIDLVVIVLLSSSAGWSAAFESSVLGTISSTWWNPSLKILIVNFAIILISMNCLLVQSSLLLRRWQTSMNSWWRTISCLLRSLVFSQWSRRVDGSKHRSIVRPDTSLLPIFFVESMQEWLPSKPWHTSISKLTDSLGAIGSLVKSNSLHELSDASYWPSWSHILLFKRFPHISSGPNTLLSFNKKLEIFVRWLVSSISLRFLDKNESITDPTNNFSGSNYSGEFIKIILNNVKALSHVGIEFISFSYLILVEFWIFRRTSRFDWSWSSLR